MRFLRACEKGKAVPPYTPISAAEVRAGKYSPRNPAALPCVLAYLDALEAAGRYRLMAREGRRKRKRKVIAHDENFKAN